MSAREGVQHGCSVQRFSRSVATNRLEPGAGKAMRVYA